LIQFPTTNRAGSRVSWGRRTRGAEQIPFLVLDGRWRESTGKNGGTHLPEGKWGINPSVMEELKASFVSTGSIPIEMDKYNKKIMIVTVKDPDLFRVEN
jgi:hypothetical protein